MREIITSVQNPKIKELLALQEKSRLRRKEGIFVLEGRRELERCIAAGMTVRTVFVCPEILGGGSAGQTLLQSSTVSPSRRGEKFPPHEKKSSEFFSPLLHHPLAPLSGVQKNVLPGGKRPEIPAGGSENVPPDRMALGDGSSATPILPTSWVPSLFGSQSRLSRPANPEAGLELTPESSSDLGPAVFEVSAAVYARIAYREGTEGVMAIVETPELGLERLNLPEKPLIVVLESVEKPGNLGAVLRSADAAGADAVIVCDPLADVFNPNVIRASTGAVFSVPVAVASSEEAIVFLKKNNIRILTAQLQDSVLYYDSDMTDGTAIVMGTEDKGLSDIWRKAANEHIRIPMLGVADSLNVSVSAAILLFEAVRQRQGDARSSRA